MRLLGAVATDPPTAASLSPASEAGSPAPPPRDAPAPWGCRQSPATTNCKPEKLQNSGLVENNLSAAQLPRLTPSLRTENKRNKKWPPLRGLLLMSLALNCPVVLPAGPPSTATFWIKKVFGVRCAPRHCARRRSPALAGALGSPAPWAIEPFAAHWSPFRKN